MWRFRGPNDVQNGSISSGDGMGHMGSDGYLDQSGSYFDPGSPPPPPMMDDFLPPPPPDMT